MIAASLCLVFGAALASAGDLHVAVPQSPLYVSVAWPNFARDAALERAAAAQFGTDQVVFGGTIEAEATTITVLCEKGSVRTSAQLRTALGDDQGTPFSVGGIACSERRVALQGTGSANDFHAYFPAGAMAIDVHATSAALSGDPELDRRDFEKLVTALAISFPRRGTAANLPADVRELMHGAICEGTRWREWLEAQRRTRRDQLALEFARGELAILAGSKLDLVIEAHRASLEWFAKLKTPNAQQRFAWMLAEESLGLALSETGKLAEAAEQLQKSYEIACQLKSAERWAIAFNLARACGASERPADALKYLNEAIAGDSQYRGLAARDRSFASVASDKRFQALVRP